MGDWRAGFGQWDRRPVAHVRVVRAAALGQLTTEYRAVRHMFHLKVPLCPVCCLQAALGLRRTVVGSIYLRGGRATGEGPT